MPRTVRAATCALQLSLVLIAAGCGPSTLAPTASPGTSAGPAASPSSATVETPIASSTPSVPSSPATRPLPSAIASGPTCTPPAQTGLLPSDRMVGLAISSTTTHDLVTFIFATPGAPSPAGPPQGALSAAQPPFSHAGSGQPIDLLGQHAVQVRFSGMTLSSESGQATYTGPTEVRPNLPALREAIQYDASEGIVGWYIGWDGPGCVTLDRHGTELTVMIGHPEAPAG